jgi:type VI secretion system (T6SS) baseplate-like injector VgrG
MMHGQQQFFGKFRGAVTNNVDPMLLGRVQVSVPAVLGSGRLSWAMPCAPYAGPQVGFFAVPPIGANVWVEFEGGDPDYPILAGCFWGAGEVPASPAVANMKVFKTDGVTLTFSDIPSGGGLTIEVTPPVVPMALKMVFDASGIQVVNGSASIKLTPSSVSVNNGALEVI